ncbi:MAG: UbiD family decarboxylase [Thermoanaerobaculia bacterium]|nr:UbiD family decarboxylase [Thermoanaerobaculia bacterium]
MGPSRGDTIAPPAGGEPHERALCPRSARVSRPRARPPSARDRHDRARGFAGLRGRRDRHPAREEAAHADRRDRPRRRLAVSPGYQRLRLVATHRACAGLDAAQLETRLDRAYDQLVPPTPWIGEGPAPIRQNIRRGEQVDLGLLPQCRYTESETHPYMAAATVVARDPTTRSAEPQLSTG